MLYSGKRFLHCNGHTKGPISPSDRRYLFFSLLIVNKAIIKKLEITTPFRRRNSTTAIKHLIFATDTKLEIQLNLGPSFIFSDFDAIVFDIHLDGRLVHSDLLKEADEHTIIKDITRETNGRWKTRSFHIANVEAQDSQAKLYTPPHPVTYTHPPLIVDSRSSRAIDSSSTVPEPRYPGPWRDLTAADKKDSRYLTREPGTIKIQAYRAKNLKANTTTEKKDQKADATTKRSVAENAARTEALREIPQPLDLHENDIKDRDLTHTIVFEAAPNAGRPLVVAPANKLYLDPTN